MRLDTRGLQAFVAIVEHGGFQKAAHALAISQAGLSRRLKNLESQLSVRLIDRTTRAWRLSAVGRSFLPRAQRLMAEMNDAFTEIRDAGRRNQAEVTIACVASMAFHLLPQIVLRYAKEFPHNRVRIIDATGPEVADAVRNKRADFGVSVLAGSQDGLTAASLLRDPFVFMCREDHRLAGRAQVRWCDLQDEALILLNRSTGNGLILESALHELKLTLRRLYEVQHPSTALGLVALGAGAAILPSLIILREAYPRIRTVSLVGPTLSREIGLVQPASSLLTPAAAALYAMVEEGFRAWGRPAAVQKTRVQARVAARRISAGAGTRRPVA